MAFYDKSLGRITLRIVYDGLGTAGKTTNVERIYEAFTLARRGDIIAPEVAKGRTLYFDWLELDAGTIDGYHLTCQVLTVPGQFAFAQRRWELLRQLDAIVAVCDSTPAGLSRAALGMRFLRELRARGSCPGVPILVQANKRDLVEAAPLHEVRRALDLSTDEKLFEAVALTGEGIRYTFLMALDAAREGVRRKLAAGGPEFFEPQVETADELYERIRDAEDRDADNEGMQVMDALAEQIANARR